MSCGYFKQPLKWGPLNAVQPLQSCPHQAPTRLSHLPKTAKWFTGRAETENHKALFPHPCTPLLLDCLLMMWIITVAKFCTADNSSDCFSFFLLNQTLKIFSFPRKQRILNFHVTAMLADKPIPWGPGKYSIFTAHISIFIKAAIYT